MPLISLEDHFLSVACQEDNGAKSLNLHQYPPEVVRNFTEVGPIRIKHMDEGDITLQVVSHGPFIGDINVCRGANQQLRAAVENHPARLAGFAMLPMAEPDNIAAELERTVKQFGFVGALIPNHAHGIYYDGSDYYPMFEKAQQLDVPIYLHPCPASAARLSQFQGNYSQEAAFSMSTHVWDWHADTAVHVIRLYAAGIIRSLSESKTCHWTYGRNVAVHATTHRKEVQDDWWLDKWQDIQTGVRREHLDHYQRHV